jgi:large subunit ribosomal protein L17
MLANMATSLILNKRIATTLAKAKELKKYIEPMITKAKVDSTHNRRTVFSSLKHKEPIKELFSTVIEKVGDRPGGYTRILKTGHRLGDNADMCIIELVDFNDSYTTQKEVAKAKTRRGRAKKASDTATLTPSDVNTATEMAETVTSAEVIEDTPTMEAHTEVIEEVAVECT